MFFRNTYIKHAVWILLFKVQKARTARHCCCNGANFRILCRQFNHCLSKSIRKSRDRCFQRNTGFRIKFTDTMKQFRVFFRVNISLSLLRHRMNQNGATHISCDAQQGNHLLRIVTIYRSKIGKAHTLKDSCGHQHTSDPILNIMGKAIDMASSGQF